MSSVLPSPYQALPGKRHIRLLRLSQKLPLNGVRASLTTVALDTAPKFEAISYRWQQPNDAASITIDGCPFPAFVAVAEMLAGFSSMWHSRLVWIDVICINQEDLEERSSQV